MIVTKSAYMRVNRFVLVLAGLLIGSVAAAQGNPFGFTADEIRTLLRHGPWPVPWSRDGSNRVSGKPEAIAFGERLFFEPRLSANWHRFLCVLPPARAPVQ